MCNYYHYDCKNCELERLKDEDEGESENEKYAIVYNRK